MKKTGPNKRVVAVLAARHQGICERCGRRPMEQIHHREPRGMGGTSDPAINSACNLLGVCSPCHLAIELDRTVAYEQGWLVRRGHNPAKTPVWLAGRGFVLLTDAGDIHEFEEESA